MRVHLCSTPISYIFFFNDTATTEIYTLSLHDALPISAARQEEPDDSPAVGWREGADRDCPGLRHLPAQPGRSEEHTSELQSHLNLVCRLLLEKKKYRSTKKSTALCRESCHEPTTAHAC